ncbi:uncharacterized protein LOC128741652 isoform X2 [Sabethes cyaneus]|uniref:uncharacterized protein LOC128741652 isoform X2 n=1 Tax=Sabethes cyaneus TaxID=53552 RepID=UPI00237E81DE|nr:uncharacterized protein LOC128741652 isoform X2 [Sabethes cyaneus]
MTWNFRLCTYIALQLTTFVKSDGQTVVSARVSPLELKEPSAVASLWTNGDRQDVEFLRWLETLAELTQYQTELHETTFRLLQNALSDERKSFEFISIPSTDKKLLFYFTDGLQMASMYLLHIC